MELGSSAFRLAFLEAPSLEESLRAVPAGHRCQINGRPDESLVDPLVRPALALERLRARANRLSAGSAQ